MATLSSLVLRTEKLAVETEGGVVEIPLRGLSADALAFLAQDHGEQLGAIYSMVVSGNLDATNATAALTALLDEAPIFVATVIAFAAGEPAAIENAAALPLSTQLEALEKIWHLTFAGEHAPKKALAIVNRVVAAMGAMVPTPPQPSENGSTA